MRPLFRYRIVSETSFLYYLLGVMTNAFATKRQEQLYRAILFRLRGIGYTDELLQEDYQFNDWFDSGCPQRQINAAAFAQTPLSYDTACVGVFLSANGTDARFISSFRSLGAPLLFEIRDDHVVPWRVGKDTTTTSSQPRILPQTLDAAFRDNKTNWSPGNILRAKNIGLGLGPRQLDFIDLGLIPALEHEISRKLDYFLRHVLQVAEQVHARGTGSKPDIRELFRLVFRLLTAKILHDRRIDGFRNLGGGCDARQLLSRVSNYYRDRLPVLADVRTQQAVADLLWQQINFQNLSVEILAYIYENTLVDEATRKHLGIHSTPRSIARYIVHRLPMENIPVNERLIVEPCSGHGVFLVAALKRLRDLLPKDMNPQARHRYFVKMLHGFETDEFAVEVSKLCLMLADFPNHNGWRIQKADVFSSARFITTLKCARVVLCNPPFEDFGMDERRKYKSLQSIQKPVDILKRVLQHLPKNGLLGFVLPRQFISGKGYGEIRAELTKRFSDLEVVSLPDRVFRHSQVETSLVIGRVPEGDRSSTTVSFVEVNDRDRTQFLEQHTISRHDVGDKTVGQARNDLIVPPLNELWQRLKAHPQLRDAADVHRGVEWKQPFDERKYLSRTKRPGFERGLNSPAGKVFCFEVPPALYLSTKKEHQRGHAFDLPWNAPKVIMNAVRKSRGPWKIVAFVDEGKLLCSQSFHCLWPKRPWTTKSLAAILNGPLACAFVHAMEYARHIRVQTVRRIPLPKLTAAQVTAIDRLVDEYVKLVEHETRGRLELWGMTDDSARRCLLEIDAMVLKGYDLPPRLERDLLEFFRGERRPVPFEFGEYFPEDFEPTLPLWMYISKDFQKCTAEHLLRTIPRITDPSLIEALNEVE